MPFKLLGILLLCSSMLMAKPLKFAQISNSPDQIIGAQILKILYAEADIAIEVISMSGKRALIESSQGRLDGEVHRILEIGDMYPDLVRVPIATNYIEETIFTKDKNFIIDGCDSLKGKLVGRARGVRYAEVCTQGMDTVAVFPDSSSLMKSLERDIVDYAITSRINGLVHLKKIGIGSVVAIQPPLRKRLLFHYLHKKHKKLLPKLTRILQQMQQNGDLEAIRSQQIQKIIAKIND